MVVLTFVFVCKFISSLKVESGTLASFSLLMVHRVIFQEVLKTVKVTGPSSSVGKDSTVATFNT
jgi:hypothetical protein